MARRNTKTFSGHTILVVDDDEAILESVRVLLEREGHRVLTAQSGPVALEIIKANELQLLLIDYFMPRMNGAELIAEIRRFDPLVQIVLQTGYSGEKPPREMLAALDIQGYHDKGRGPADLLLWVDVALKAHGTLKRLEERERLQAELVANVSHELRTPLNVIGGYTELLAEGEFGVLEPEAQEVLGRVKDACEELSALVSDFLRYARLEAGVEEIGLAWIEVQQLAIEMERLARVLLRDEHSVTVRIEAESAPARVLSDSVKLRTVLRNLVTNAAKFTHAGEIAICFEQGPSGGLVVRVRDTGIGIAPDDREVIFEPFRQLDGSTTRTHGGIGLGLALSRKLARLLGGDLSVDSALGVGSTFTFVLPPVAVAEVPAERLGTVPHHA
jgi:signal transduction histidine kinase